MSSNTRISQLKCGDTLPMEVLSQIPLANTWDYTPTTSPSGDWHYSILTNALTDCIGSVDGWRGARLAIGLFHDFSGNAQDEYQEIKMLTVKDRFLMTAPPRGIKVVNPPIEIDARRMLELPSAGTLPVAHAALRAWYNKDQVATKDETWSSELDAARRNTNAAALLLAYRPFHLPPRPVFWTLNELSFESAAQAATFFEADLSRIWLILRFNIRLSETRAQGSLNLAMRYLSFGHMEPLDRCGKVFFLCHVRCVLTGGTKRYLGMIDPFREVRQKFRSPSLLDYRDGVSRRSLISTIGISLDDLKVKDLLILNRRNVNPVAPLVVFALQNRMHDLCTGRVSYVNPYKDACYISYDREEQRNWQSHYYELHDYVMSRWRTHGKMIHVHQDLDTGFS